MGLLSKFNQLLSCLTIVREAANRVTRRLALLLASQRIWQAAQALVFRRSSGAAGARAAEVIE
jgi:hypothetical protein